MPVIGAAGKYSRGLYLSGFLLLIAYVITSFVKGYIFPRAGLLMPLFVVPFSFGHGVLRYGWCKMIIFFLAVSAVGWSYESLSIATEFPYGSYYYTSVLGFKIGAVPLLVMPSYFAFGYLSWSLAGVLLNKRDIAISGMDLILIPAVASLIMVIWDITIDPINSTLFKAWIWRDGGAYFGVPLANFRGWFICTFTFFFLFSLANANGNQRALPPPGIANNKQYWALPALMYGGTVAEYLAGMFRFSGAGDVRVASMDGHIWHAFDIYKASALVSLFTIAPITLFCLYRVLTAFSSKSTR